MSLKKRLVKSFLGVGVMKLLSIPIGLVTSIVLARALGPESFGQYAFVMALIPLLSLPVSGGLPQLLTREIAGYVHSKSWALYQGLLRTAHIWVLILAITILLGYWVVSKGIGWVPINGKWSLVLIALIMVPFSGFAAVRVGTMKGLGFPAYAETPGQLIQPLAVLLTVAILACRGLLDINSAIYTQIAGAGLAFLFASWMFYRIQPDEAKHIEPSYALQHWKKAFIPFSLIALVSVFNIQIGVIALGMLSSDEQVAAMRVAERGSQFVALSLTLVNMVIAPYIVRAHKEGDKLLLEKLAQKSARGSFFLAFPLAIVLIVGGEFLIRLAFGAEYSSIAYWPLVILVVGQLLNVLFGSVGYVLSMCGHEKDTLRGQVASILVNILLCMLLIPNYGAIGASISVFVGLIAWNLLLTIILRKRAHLKCSAF